MKKTVLLVITALLIAGVYCGQAIAGTRITFEDEGLPGKVISFKEWQSKPGNTVFQASALRGDSSSLLQINSFVLGESGVVIHSGPPTSSPSVNAHRANTMGGLVGVLVPMDRTENPAAFYPEPEDGFQWFDYVTTMFPSWLGSTNLTVQTAGQKGLRIIVSVAGTNSVSNYTCRIVSSDTNVAATTFGVATNSTTGGELQFSATFPGINLGANGVKESFYDPAQGAWVTVGDDTIYVNGQLPSQVVYHQWYRFGATVSVTITQPSGFDAVTDQFTSADQWLSATLYKNGVTVASRTITEAIPRIEILREDDLVRVRVSGGQLRAPYTLESALDLTGAPWQTFLHQAVYSGDEKSFPADKAARFFRTKKGY